MTPEETRDLEVLRIAAEQRQWNTLQDTLKRLLANLDPLLALQVAAPRVQEFLPTFEAYYPEASWVRDLLLTVLSYASAPGELPENSINQFPSPGCGNYVRAVLDTARAVQDKYTIFERYSHITNAVANTLLATLQHQYFSQHQEEFESLLSGDQQTIARIQYNFWLDEAITQADTALWLAVVDDLETHLKSR